MGIFSHRTCSSGLPSQRLEVLKKDRMTPVLLLWFFAHVSEKNMLPGYESETTISNALIIERPFFQMFWPETWSKQNFKSLNSFFWLHFSRNDGFTCFLNRLSPKFAGSSPFLFFEATIYRLSKAPPQELPRPMQSCVDEAWFQRPDQQQGPFFFGGGNGRKWMASHWPMAAYWPRHFQKCVLSVWFNEIDKEMHTLLYFYTVHHIIWLQIVAAEIAIIIATYWINWGKKPKIPCLFWHELDKPQSLLEKRGEKRKELGSAQDGLRQD